MPTWVRIPPGPPLFEEHMKYTLETVPKGPEQIFIVSAYGETVEIENELLQDLKCIQGIDAEAEFVRVIKYELMAKKFLKFESEYFEQNPIEKNIAQSADIAIQFAIKLSDEELLFEIKK